MNKKQKILTAIALVAFSAIIALHYMSYWVPQTFDGHAIHAPHYAHFIEDVRLPIFALGVFDAGLFFILRDARPGK